MKKTYSFDIFDTCLVRTCGNPAFVFDILACRILGPKADVSAKVDFAKERYDAEKIVRQKLISGQKEEITLDEIYNYCDFTLYTNIPKEQIKSVEMQIEHEVLIPVYSVRNRISKLRAEGNLILFISDMYLPKEFILSVLVQHGFYHEGDKLYISSATMSTKRTGNLFRQIHEELNINYKFWIHSGDNRISDFDIPHKIGLKTILLKHEYSYYENMMRQHETSNYRIDLMKMAAISRAVRNYRQDSSRVRFASDFIAPIYVTFVYWLLSDAHQRGIKKIFFLARDGYILYFIAQCFHRLFHDIELKYLYVSRNSLYLPGICEITDESIEEMFLNIKKFSTVEILDRLQMNDYPVSSKLLDERDSHIFIKKLLDDEAFKAKLKAKHREQKELCKLYFEEQKLTEGNSAIVDLRGTRKCHVIINNILKEMSKPTVFGYYLEILDTHIKGIDYKALYYTHRYDIYRFKENPIYPSSIFEQYFSISDHERTSSYRLSKDGVQPVFEQDSQSLDFRKNVFQINKEICCHYANMFILLMPYCSAEFLCNTAITVYNNFTKAPKREYLDAVKGIAFEESKIRSVEIIESESVFKVLANWSKRRWREASLVYNVMFPNIMTSLLRFKAYIQQIRKITRAK